MDKQFKLNNVGALTTVQFLFTTVVVLLGNPSILLAASVLALVWLADSFILYHASINENAI
jgi:hypothetical protein